MRSRGDALPTASSRAACRRRRRRRQWRDVVSAGQRRLGAQDAGRQLGSVPGAMTLQQLGATTLPVYSDRSFDLGCRLFSSFTRMAAPGKRRVTMFDDDECKTCGTSDLSTGSGEKRAAAAAPRAGALPIPEQNTVSCTRPLPCAVKCTNVALKGFFSSSSSSSESCAPLHPHDAT